MINYEAKPLALQRHQNLIRSERVRLSYQGYFSFIRS
jgi:hypothetical protein